MQILARPIKNTNRVVFSSTNSDNDVCPTGHVTLVVVVVVVVVEVVVVAPIRSSCVSDTNIEGQAGSLDSAERSNTLHEGLKSLLSSRIKRLYSNG